VANIEGDARHRLLEHDLAGYDVAVRAWAAREPAVARRVRRVDQQRFRVVRSLLEEMGFSGTGAKRVGESLPARHSCTERVSCRGLPYPFFAALVRGHGLSLRRLHDRHAASSTLHARSGA